ncbi:hypothetical protein CASFOL_010219 [Castilleja foliolosa]|uniref:F-box domain-containing protein n=1 Tax=Castilleja foliolosa TaxID=1961234 RepID=A0ABD3DW02_9LAMI
MAGEGEIYFPEPIIQRIQSFLTGKEAARTAILSKSWHGAWLTRPNLDFDDTYFRVNDYRNCSSYVDKFKKYARTTIKRYEQSNLRIESFKLRMHFDKYHRADFAEEYILKALGVGAIRLCLRLKRSGLFVLPNEVFEVDNLVELSVSGCRIKLDDRVVIKCRRLESLSLDKVRGITIDTVSKIVSSCPSIEKFSLLSEFYQEYRFCPKATAMAVGVVDNLIPRLRCLVLSYASFKALCLDELLSRFPFLKDFSLYLNHCTDTILEEGIQISNRSLERIKLVLKGFARHIDRRRLRVKFDVPSVRKFTFEGDDIPCLSFMSIPTSREWESHLSIKCLTTFWFNDLSKLLTELSRSKTHLSLTVGSDTVSFAYNVEDKIVQGLRKHKLENLRVHTMVLPPL